MSRYSVKDLEIENRIYEKIIDNIVKKNLEYNDFINNNTIKLIFSDDIIKLTDEIINNKQSIIKDLIIKTEELYTKSIPLELKINTYIDLVNEKTTNHCDKLKSELQKDYNKTINEIEKINETNKKEIKEIIRKNKIEFSDMKMDMSEKVGIVEKMEEHIMELKQQLIECKDEMSKMSIAYGTVIQQFTELSIKNKKSKRILNIFNRNNNSPPLATTTTTSSFYEEEEASAPPPSYEMISSCEKEYPSAPPSYDFCEKE